MIVKAAADQRARAAERALELGIDTPGGAGLITVVTAATCTVLLLAACVYCAFLGGSLWPEIVGISWAFIAGGLVAKAGICLLLIRHSLAFPSRSVAVLASGYLLTSVLGIPFQLALRVDTPGSEFRLGIPQTALWLYFAWSCMFSITVVVSSLLPQQSGETVRSARRWLIWSCVAVTVLAAAVGSLAIGFEKSQPTVLQPTQTASSNSLGWFYPAVWLTLGVFIIALLTAFLRALSGSRLRVWLLVAILFHGAATFVLLFADQRWTAGWYTWWLLGIAGSWVVLTVLIAEVISQSGNMADALLSRDELSQIIEAAADGILAVNQQGRITWANQQAELMLGYPRGLEGISVDELVPAELRSGVQREQERILSGSSADVPGSSREVDLLQADGGRFTADVSIRLVATRSGAVLAIAFRDASERLEHEHQLAAVRERLIDATEQAPIGQAVVTLPGTYVEVNEAFCHLTGYPRHELLGMTFESITHPDDLEAQVRLRDEVAAGLMDGFAMEKRYVRRDGDLVWVDLHVAAMKDRDGKVVAFNTQVIDVNARKMAERQAADALADLSYRSTHDPLTGVLNHRELLLGLTAVLAQDPANPQDIGVLFFDIDRFKDINDGLGHAAGDEVLAEIGRRMRSRVRSTDLVGRVGGDEFVVVLTDLPDALAAVAAAEGFRAEVSADKLMVGGRQITLTMSVGVAVGTRGMAADTLIAQSDEALLRAKSNGRNRTELYDTGMELAAARRLQLAAEIREGVAADQFHAWFQPIVDLRSGVIVGYEALARWIRGEDDVVTASEFIAVAEEIGAIVDIGSRVTEEAIAYLATLPPEMTMAINASPGQIGDGRFGRELLSSIDAEDVNPNRVVLELTEHAILNLNAGERQLLDGLWARGVRLDVDDFGTGYSALSHVRELPVTGLKLDQSFTGDLQRTDSGAFRLAQGVALLAASLRLTDVAEGVETRKQAKLLLQAGWTRGQGYLFGGAAPPPPGVRARMPRPRTGAAERPVPRVPEPRGRRHND